MQPTKASFRAFAGIVSGGIAERTGISNRDRRTACGRHRNRLEATPPGVTAMRQAACDSGRVVRKA